MGFFLMFKVVQVWGGDGNFEEFRRTLEKFRPVFPISKYFPQNFEIFSKLPLGIQLHFEGKGGRQIAQKMQKFKFENVFGVFGQIFEFSKIFFGKFFNFLVEILEFLSEKIEKLSKKYFRKLENLAENFANILN